MFNKFLKRTLFLTVALTGGIVGSVYSSTHQTHELDDPAPQVQGSPNFTNQPIQGHGLLALAVVALPSSHSEGDGHGQWWDSDSKIVGVDDWCSACISDRESDFAKGTLVSVNRTIKGFAGLCTSSGIKMGTIRWKVQDDDRREHVWEIPGSYYVLQGGMRLFSPQHWSQTRPSHDQIK
jgi:hypothetical protein